MSNLNCLIERMDEVTDAADMLGVVGPYHLTEEWPDIRAHLTWAKHNRVRDHDWSGYPIDFEILFADADGWVLVDISGCLDLPWIGG